MIPFGTLYQNGIIHLVHRHRFPQPDGKRLREQPGGHPEGGKHPVKSGAWGVRGVYTRASRFSVKYALEEGRPAAQEGCLRPTRKDSAITM